MEDVVGATTVGWFFGMLTGCLLTGMLWLFCWLGSSKEKGCPTSPREGIEVSEDDFKKAIRGSSAPRRTRRTMHD